MSKLKAGGEGAIRTTAPWSDRDRDNERDARDVFTKDLDLPRIQLLDGRGNIVATAAGLNRKVGKA